MNVVIWDGCARLGTVEASLGKRTFLVVTRGFSGSDGTDAGEYERCQDCPEGDGVQAGAWAEVPA